MEKGFEPILSPSEGVVITIILFHIFVVPSGFKPEITGSKSVVLSLHYRTI